MRTLNRKLTDKEIADLEQRIYDIFSEAKTNMEGIVSRYYRNLFGNRDIKMQKLLKLGQITQAEYNTWMRAQMGRGKAFDTLRDNIAAMLTNCNQSALSMTNEAVAGVYSLNRNISSYIISQYNPGVDFTLWNENAVRNMLVYCPDVMPYYPPERALDRGIDLAYGKKMISRQATVAMLQGSSSQDFAKILVANITGMSARSAIRAARTSLGAAMSAGTLDSYEEAKALGIKVQKQWESTGDGRTRDSHIELDGVRVETDAKFPNGLRYPCDPYGHPREVYNCRCCLIPVLPETKNTIRNTGNTVESFNRWADEQRAAGHGIDYTWFRQNEFPGYQPGTFLPMVKDAVPAAARSVKEINEIIKNKKWYKKSHFDCTIPESVGADGAEAILLAQEQFFNRFPDMQGRIKGFAFAELDFGTYADCQFGFDGGIRMNIRRYKDWDALTERYRLDTTHNWNPFGTTSKDILMHEMGHALDSYMSFCQSFASGNGVPDIRDLLGNKTLSGYLRPRVMKACGLKVKDCGLVSSYAKQDAQEWFAECFAEYMGSPNPRPIAVEFGRQLSEIYGVYISPLKR